MRVISIITLKGGAGKTSAAANLAHLLNGRGYSVLLVDNDKQGNLSKQFGAYNGDTEPGTSRLLRGWYQEINQVREPLPAYPCMDIITANMQLLQTTHDIARTDEADQVERFKPLLQAYPLTPDKPYDFCIIDNPPDLGLNVLNALVITDDVIVPTKIDKWSLEGMETIIDQVEQLKQVNNNQSPGRRRQGSRKGRTGRNRRRSSYTDRSREAAGGREGSRERQGVKTVRR